jgi:3'-phosphoadenosine 5'-phosphosulfate sulfotransferase (PAPS reductase)/FAD synthetase
MVHFFCTYFPEYLDKIHFVFSNTGLEYEATRKHLIELENRYGIVIERVKGLSVVTVVDKYGVPIISKEKSLILHYYMKNAPYAVRQVEGIGEYGKDGKKSKRAFTEKEKALAAYCKDNDIAISERCCYFSKKKPLHQYNRTHNIDLSVTGERKSEGGRRATTHKSCFEEHKNGEHKYMPLWWWSDTTKRIFKETENITYSDCYEIWGMKRTGCVGCPFNSNISEDLKMIKEYEPKLYKACLSVFGKSYEIMDKFKVRRKPCLPENERSMKNE